MQENKVKAQLKASKTSDFSNIVESTQERNFDNLSQTKFLDKNHAPFFEKQLLSYKEAARYLSISEVYLRRLKQQGKVPFVQVGRRGVRFRLSSLNSWVEEREIK